MILNSEADSLTMSKTEGQTKKTPKSLLIPYW